MPRNFELPTGQVPQLACVSLTSNFRMGRAARVPTRLTAQLELPCHSELNFPPVSSGVSDSDPESFFEPAYNSIHSPTTEKPLCPCLVTSCLTRCTRMVPLILTLVGPNSADIMISTLTAASTGGLVGVKMNAPTALMSRVDPSPWKRSRREFSQLKTTGTLNR
jgi:hypothetical protein